MFGCLRAIYLAALNEHCFQSLLFTKMDSDSIKLSDSLVNKLHDQLVSENSKSEQDVSSKNVDPSENLTLPKTMNPEYVAKNISYDSSINLYGSRGQYEHKLQQYQQAWRERWEQLNELNTKILEDTKERLDNKLDQVEKKYFPRDYCKEMRPCVDKEAAVIRCYKQNPGQPLNCCEETKMFKECLNKERLDCLDLFD